MRTLKKLSLDVLKSKMPVISEMELKEFIGRGWGEDFLGAIYHAGYNSTINITDFIKPVDPKPNGYYPISASGIALSIGNIDLSGISIQGSTSNNFPYMDTGHGWTKDVISSGVVEKRNYIYDVYGTSEDLWIIVPGDQIANFEKLFKDHLGR